MEETEEKLGKEEKSISIQEETLKSIESLENWICQASQFAQAMSEDVIKGRERPWTIDESVDKEHNVDECWKLLQKIKKLVKKW